MFATIGAKAFGSGHKVLIPYDTLFSGPVLLLLWTSAMCVLASFQRSSTYFSSIACMRMAFFPPGRDFILWSMARLRLQGQGEAGFGLIKGRIPSVEESIALLFESVNFEKVFPKISLSIVVR